MKIVSIVGARPQFVKLAAFIRAIEASGQAEGPEHVIVHTGQHYDVRLSKIFVEELEIPEPDFNLEVGSGPHGAQTGLMLSRIEEALLSVRAEVVVVYGDTNSTVAGALAASKLHIPLAHVEAGLRSYNRKMPEEINRIVADHVSDLLLAPTATAVENLRMEGLGSRAVLTGDIMYEAVLRSREVARSRSRILESLVLRPGGYGLVTLHRAENTSDHGRFNGILSGLNMVAAEEVPLVFPVHPRTAKLIAETHPEWVPHRNLRLIEPLGYFDMLQLLSNARVALTDSGGLQKEAFFVGCPCITIRQETEWGETVTGGGNVLIEADAKRIVVAVKKWRDRYPFGRGNFSDQARALFGDTRAAQASVEAICHLVGGARSPARAGNSEPRVAACGMSGG